MTYREGKRRNKTENVMVMFCEGKTEKRKKKGEKRERRKREREREKSILHPQMAT